MKPYRLLIYIVFFTLQGHLTAQVKSIDLILGSGFNHIQLRDKAMSPMIYSGGSMYLFAGMDESTSWYYEHLEISYQHEQIRPDLENKSSADFMRGEINYLFTPTIAACRENSRLNLGGHVLFNYTHTFHSTYPNNDYSYHLSWSIGPTFSLDHYFNRDNGPFYLHFDISVPLVTYAIRPGIASETQEGSIRKERYDFIGFIMGGRITSLKRFQRVSTRIFTKFKLANIFYIQPAYQWDYMNFNNLNKITQARHILSVSLLYSISRE